MDLPRFNGAFEARETLASYNDTITSKAGLSTGLGVGQVTAPSVAHQGTCPRPGPVGNSWDELAEVFQRDKFEPKLARGQRLRVLAELARYVDIASAKSIITVCRDVKDNKFLSLALDAAVPIWVTGDKALLELHPWHGVNIVGLSDFVREHGKLSNPNSSVQQ